MKKDKWLKWKIGAVASVGVAFLFNEVKSSAAFQQAAAGAAVANEPAPAVAMPERSHGRGGFRGGGSFGGGEGLGDNGGYETNPQQQEQRTVPHTRTSRS